MSFLPAGLATVAGQIEPKGEVRTEAKAEAINNQAFLKGDVLCNVAGTWRKCTSGDIGPFAVCITAKATTDTRVEYVDQVGVEVSVIADGAITPEGFVKPSTATDGQVMAHNPSTGTSADTQDEIIGRYIKRKRYVPEGDGVTAAAAAANDDIIIIRLGTA